MTPSKFDALVRAIDRRRRREVVIMGLLAAGIGIATLALLWWIDR